MTTVRDLSTGAEYTYSLEPTEAVVTAYRQYVLKDFYWWLQPSRDVPALVFGERTVSCGNMCARRKGGIR